MYANVTFLAAPKEAPTYLKFVRELLFKKGESGNASMATTKEACNALLQSRSSSKMYYLCSFSILMFHKGYADRKSSL